MIAGAPYVIHPNSRDLEDGPDFRLYVQVTLDQDAAIDGFDIYSSPEFSSLGQNVNIVIRPDETGVPASTPLFDFVDQLDTEVAVDADTNLVGAHFNTINLAAGTYWFGMGGADAEFGWKAFIYQDTHAPEAVFQFGEYTPQTSLGILTLGYAVESGGMTTADLARFTSGVAPEPAAWALMLTGFFGMGISLRRQRAARPG